MSRRGSELPVGLAVHIAEVAGLELRGSGDKRQLRCPFHSDRHPSAFISFERNLFHCSGCGRTYSAKRFAEELQVPWVRRERQLSSRPSEPAKTPEFTPAHAQAVWGLALDRCRDDNYFTIEADNSVHDYLAARCLDKASDLDLCGVLNSSMSGGLPEVVRWWPGSGYQLVCPLYAAESGELVSVQARNVLEDSSGGRKVLFPSGSRASGTVFANDLGRKVLRGDRSDRPVLLGEGLTDFLALSIVWRGPVLCAPGTGVATGAIDSWVSGRRVMLVFDSDESGRAAAASASKRIARRGGEFVRFEWGLAGITDACEAISALGAREFGESLDRVVRENLREIPGNGSS